MSVSGYPFAVRRLGKITRGIIASSLCLLFLAVFSCATFAQDAALADSASLSQGSGLFDGPAELPRAYVLSALSNTPTPGKKTTVNAGGDLQGALNSASCGDIIQLQAGATFTGTFTFPAKKCDDQHWIMVRTAAADSSLPPENTRLTPCFAGVASLPGRPALNCKSTNNVMAKISMNSKGASGPVVFAVGANHYRLLGLEITRNAGIGVVYNLASLQSGGPADHIVFDRVWMHGTAKEETTRGIMLGGSTNLAVVDSFFTDFHCISQTGSCTDAQAISGGLGDLPQGPYKIVNNFLEASAQSIVLGGDAATVTPADIQVSRNHMFKPLIWMKGQPGYIGVAFSVKNHFELKNAQRVLLEGNIMEYTWGGFSQAGFSILLTPKNQAINKINVCPLCEVTDVTIRYNQVSHVGSGMQIANGLSDAGGVPLDGQRYSVHDNTFDDINAVKYAGSGIFAQVSMGDKAPVMQNVLLNHNTAFAPNELLSIGDDTNVNPLMRNFTFTNNLANAGLYPVWSTGGSNNCAILDSPLTTLNACFTPWVFSKNGIFALPNNSPSSEWPTGNYFPANAAAVQFVNYNNGIGGDYHLKSTSPYRNAGSDGKDLGADINLVLSKTAGVL